MKARWTTERLGLVALAAILIAFAVLAATAARRTSTTFDEILLPSAGARGLHLGEFNLVIDHPPLLQYVYGLPIALSRVNYPAEPPGGWTYDQRYLYARAFYWQSGNDAEMIAFRARLMGVLIGVLLIATVYAVTRAWVGTPAAVVAALLVAFIPDVLAHSGISYNDVPLALVLVLAAFTLDRAVREPSFRRVALAGFVSGLAIAAKFSAIVIGPLAVLLLVLEAAAGRWRDTGWWKRVGLGLPVFTVVLYLTLVAAYVGDFRLRDFWFGLGFNLRHASGGHWAFLLGERSPEGWWYYFPLAFLLKTSAALHLLLVVAAAMLVRALRGRLGTTLLAHPLRTPFAAGGLFLLVVILSDLNIGFRHAMPILPFACMLIAAGVVAAWRTGRPLRLALAGLLAWNTASAALAWPWFISYLSEYAGPEEDSYRLLADSSLDWGQGLLELRRFMREHDIPVVYLSYFGTALPEGYGIDYLPLPSFAPLSARRMAEGQPPPRFLAVSATNLSGVYLGTDPFASLRGNPPLTVLGGSIWLYPVDDSARR
jgi:4-amino-4-deoxy-L-arabinose transferase-like glycosyltransferase